MRFIFLVVFNFLFFTLRLRAHTSDNENTMTCEISYNFYSVWNAAELVGSPTILRGLKTRVLAGPKTLRDGDWCHGYILHEVYI